MAIDYRSELRRPLPFSLAVIAAVLLIWLVVASIAGARQRTARDHRIQDLETQQTSLRGELDSQRQATGTLAALNTKIHAAETQGQQATQAGEQARAKAASLAEEQQAAERKTSEAKTAFEEGAKRLGDVQAQVSQGRAEACSDA